MSDVRERLIEVFATAFPKLPKERIPSATRDSVDSWDSLAMLTLTALLEETFDVTVTPEALPRLVSFEGILGWLEETTAKR